MGLAWARPNYLLSICRIRIITVTCDTGLEVELAGCSGVDCSQDALIYFIVSIRYRLLHFIDLPFVGKKEHRYRLSIAGGIFATVA